MDQAAEEPPSIPSAPLAVVFTLPALVMVNGLLEADSVNGPVTALLIVWPPPLTLTVNVSVAAAEDGPPDAACVALMVWLALLNGLVGV
jgi:hypothetical protein